MKKIKIAFLDRDGVINQKKYNNGYIGHLKYFKWVKGAKKTIKFLKEKNFKVVVVTNQSGVARNYFKISDVYKIHNYIQDSLKKIDTKIDKFYFCPYHIDGIIKKYKKNSSLRKPKNGMFALAQKKWNIDKKNTFMIGDKKTDMQFAKKSGIKGYFFQGKDLYKFVKNI
tara:strand:- start:2185 stop:2691 length:507 start_codon:yes stop_codon:yes gene_type:complete